MSGASEPVSLVVPAAIPAALLAVSASVTLLLEIVRRVAITLDDDVLCERQRAVGEAAIGIAVTTVGVAIAAILVIPTVVTITVPATILAVVLAVAVVVAVVIVVARCLTNGITGHGRKFACSDSGSEGNRANSRVTEKRTPSKHGQTPFENAEQRRDLRRDRNPSGECAG